MHHTSTTMYSTPVFGYTHLDHLTHHLLQDRQYMLQLLLPDHVCQLCIRLETYKRGPAASHRGSKQGFFQIKPHRNTSANSLDHEHTPSALEPGLCAEPRLHLKPGHYSEPKICLEQLPTKLWPLLAGQQLLTAGGCTDRHHCGRCCACSPAGHPPCGV